MGAGEQSCPLELVNGLRRILCTSEKMKTTKILTVEQMRVVEQAADRGGVSFAEMMENAGKAVAEAVRARIVNPAETRVTVLAGPGNNGGDGMVAAHYLHAAGVQTSVYLSKMRPEDDPQLARLRSDGVFVVDGENDQRWRVLKNLMSGADFVIDALLGTGTQLPLKGKLAELLKQAGKYLGDRERRPFIMAVDVPSGVDSDTGQADPQTLAAALTVTLAAAKPGHFAFPAADKSGELIVADIGIPEDLPELASAQTELATLPVVRSLLPPRPRNAHKGTFGRAMVVGGSTNYTGAPYLAGVAAYRVGAGLVTLAIPTPIHAALASLLPDATWLLLPHELGVIAKTAYSAVAKELAKVDALLLGPGMGLERETREFMSSLLTTNETAVKARIGFMKPGIAAPSAEEFRLPPMVVDADGLKHLAQIDAWHQHLPERTVLTPHPGEMGILTGLTTEAVQKDRLGTARKFAAQWGKVVVLKGAFTVVAAPDGRTTVQPHATPALARAGTGDVLAGMILGLLAQGVNAYEAAVAGCFLHGTAGELAATELGTTASVMASDVLGAVPKAMASTAAG